MVLSFHHLEVLPSRWSSWLFNVSPFCGMWRDLTKFPISGLFQVLFSVTCWITVFFGLFVCFCLFVCFLEVWIILANHLVQPFPLEPISSFMIYWLYSCNESAPKFSRFRRSFLCCAKVEDLSSHLHPQGRPLALGLLLYPCSSSLALITFFFFMLICFLNKHHSNMGTHPFLDSPKHRNTWQCVSQDLGYKRQTLNSNWF